MRQRKHLHYTEDPLFNNLNSTLNPADNLLVSARNGNAPNLMPNRLLLIN